MNTTTPTQTETPQSAFQNMKVKSKKMSKSYQEKKAILKDRQQLTFAYCLGHDANKDGNEHYEQGGEGYETLELLYEDLHDQLLDNELKNVFKIEIWINREEMSNEEENDIEFKKVRRGCFQNQSWCGKFDMIAVEKEREGVCVPPELEEAEERMEEIARQSEESDEELRLGMEEAMMDQRLVMNGNLSEEEVAFQDVV